MRKRQFRLDKSPYNQSCVSAHTKTTWLSWAKNILAAFQVLYLHRKFGLTFPCGALWVLRDWTWAGLGVNSDQLPAYKFARGRFCLLTSHMEHMDPAEVIIPGCWQRPCPIFGNMNWLQEWACDSVQGNPMCSTQCVVHFPDSSGMRALDIPYKHLDFSILLRSQLGFWGSEIAILSNSWHLSFHNVLSSFPSHHIVRTVLVLGVRWCSQRFCWLVVLRGVA